MPANWFLYTQLAVPVTQVLMTANLATQQDLSRTHTCTPNPARLQQRMTLCLTTVYFTRHCGRTYPTRDTVLTRLPSSGFNVRVYDLEQHNIAVSLTDNTPSRRTTLPDVGYFLLDGWTPCPLFCVAYTFLFTTPSRPYTWFLVRAAAWFWIDDCGTRRITHAAPMPSGSVPVYLGPVTHRRLVLLDTVHTVLCVAHAPTHLRGCNIYVPAVHPSPFITNACFAGQL